MLLLVLFHFGPDTEFTFTYVIFHLAKFTVLSFRPIEIILNVVLINSFYVILKRVIFKTGFHFVKQMSFKNFKIYIIIIFCSQFVAMSHTLTWESLFKECLKIAYHCDLTLF